MLKKATSLPAYYLLEQYLDCVVIKVEQMRLDLQKWAEGKRANMPTGLLKLLSKHDQHWLVRYPSYIVIILFDPPNSSTTSWTQLVVPEYFVQKAWAHTSDLTIKNKHDPTFRIFSPFNFTLPVHIGVERSWSSLSTLSIKPWTHTSDLTLFKGGHDHEELQRNSLLSSSGCPCIPVLPAEVTG